jgi:transcriptional regulator with XRE-family HTH domain
MDAEELTKRSGIGERIKAERLRIGLTPEDFAEKVGVHRSTVFNYESGARVPDAVALERMHDLARVDVLFVVVGQRAQMSELTETDRTLLECVGALPHRLRAVVEDVALLSKLAFDARPGYDYTGALAGGPDPAPALKPTKRKPA